MVLGWQSVINWEDLQYLVVVEPALTFWREWGGGGKEKILGGKSEKNAHKACKHLLFLTFLCWNPQIWSNINTFVIIWG